MFRLLPAILIQQLLLDGDTLVIQHRNVIDQLVTFLQTEWLIMIQWVNIALIYDFVYIVIFNTLNFAVMVKMSCTLRRVYE